MAPANSVRHLLVVDDEPHIGLVLRPFLEQLGYRVSVARTLEDRQEVWDGPIFYGTLLAALFAEWVLRKRCRLV